MQSVAVIGGRGFVGGELARILASHPGVSQLFMTSESEPGKLVETQHPPLRGSNLRYVRRSELPAVDVAFLAGPHGSSIELKAERPVDARVQIDLTADYRLSDCELMEKYYGWTRTNGEPANIAGIAELYRSEITNEQVVSIPGCMALTTILMLAPLARRNLLDSIHVDARTGSSGSGASGSGTADRHPSRAGAMRIFAPFGHRHEAEILEHLNVDCSLTVTATPQVRGIQTVAKVKIPNVDIRDLMAIYQNDYLDEPFVRVLASKRGPFRHPDPKVLLGSNFCDIGIAHDPEHRSDEFLLMAATDNLVKGAAGTAVHCMNLMTGNDETLGLTFPGLHPI